MWSRSSALFFTVSVYYVMNPVNEKVLRSQRTFQFCGINILETSIFCFRIRPVNQAQSGKVAEHKEKCGML